ncbi:MAG TPA: autoinducer binding domain-containing protein [Nevskiaceae bacterium]|nr:autoinducer binding domain-containing protein [Nevskiaceae bacterium]
MDADHVFTSRLTHAQGAPDLHAICREWAAGVGFPLFFYAVRIPVSLTQPYHFCLSGYPPLWRQRYDSGEFVRIDPIVRHAFTSPLPVIWDELDRSAPPVKAFFDEAATHGLVHGITAPVAGRRGDLALLSLARPEPIPADAGERHGLRMRLMWFGTLLHEAVRRVVLTSEGNPLVSQPLSDREKDVLMWAADGKTSQEIARLLSITERTVLFHIESAGRKLGTTGRHNVIARAVALGEVDLNSRALDAGEVAPVLVDAPGSPPPGTR